MFTVTVMQAFNYTPPDGDGTVSILACRDNWPGAPRRAEIWQISVPTVYQLRLTHNAEFSSLEEACAAIADAFGIAAHDVQDGLVRAMRGF